MEMAVPPDAEDLPLTYPREVGAHASDPPREPCAGPTLDISVELASGPPPKHRLAVIGDSLAHGFQSGAIFNTDISFPAIVAYELGCLDQFRYPRYGGPGAGIPFNIEYLPRDLESRFGAKTSVLELPLALFRAREFLDGVEDYWERGPGSIVPELAGYMHDLGIYGWDLRDALSKSANSCRALIAQPRDNFVDQIVENSKERAALRVYPSWPDSSWSMTLFDAAAALGDDHDDGAGAGIERTKLRQGSRYFPYYARPWIDDAHFDTDRDRYLTGADALAIDTAIDLYNDAIQSEVEQARNGADGTVRIWYLLDLAGVLDQLASPIMVDFERLIRRDTLITHPPQKVNSMLDILEWADITLGMINRALQFKS
jgi:hypothetical protein